LDTARLEFRAGILTATWRQAATRSRGILRPALTRSHGRPKALQAYEVGHPAAPPALLISEERNTLEAVL